MNYSKNILLTGAGFTKNFGGFLAEEMWAQILVHPEVQKEWKVIEFMHNEFNYEKVYYEIMHEQSYLSVPQYKKAIHNALMQVYENLDYRIHNNYPDSHEGIFQLINLFKGAEDEVGLVFSLNQDLYIERLFMHKSIEDLMLPGLDNDPYKTGWQKYINTVGYNYLKLENEIDIRLPVKKLNYIKLHGSCNWKSRDGSNAVVIGLNKKDAIDREPLLKEYYRVFQEALFQKDVKLLVIGYGFGDDHINEIISKSLEYIDNNEERMKLYVVSPEPPSEFKKKLCEPRGLSKNGSEYRKRKEIGRGIFDRLAGYFQCNLTEFTSYLYERNHYFNRIKEIFS